MAEAGRALWRSSDPTSLLKHIADAYLFSINYLYFIQAEMQYFQVVWETAIKHRDLNGIENGNKLL